MMIKFQRSEIILVLILLILSITVWRHIPSLQIQGEGFIYFTPSISAFYTNLPLPFDLFAKVVFNILPLFFNGQVFLYMWFLFIWMILTDMAFYLMVRIITRKAFIAILATFIFILNYAGKYDMFSIGGYQYFVQRGAILLPQLFSFLFLSLYFHRGFKRIYYYLSLLLYDFSIILGFFGTWFLPPFLLFPFFYLIFNFKTLKKFFWKIIWTPLPFLISNLLIIRHSGFIPEDSIFSYVFNNFLYVVKGILQQLAVVTPPFSELLKRFHKESLQFEAILGLTFVLYCIAFMVIYKISKNLRVLAATALVSLIVIFLFNVYLNAANVLNTFGSSRYFYFPFTMVAIFWGLFFYSLASKRRSGLNFLLIFCFIWLLYNVYRIDENLKVDAWIHRANKETIDYVARISGKFKENSFVYLPANLGGWGQEFVSRFYGRAGTKFSMEVLEPLDLENLIEQKFDPVNVYVLHYDPVKQEVFDITEESREKMRKLKQYR